VNSSGRNSRLDSLARFAVRSFRFQVAGRPGDAWAGEIRIGRPWAGPIAIRGPVTGVRMLAISGLPLGLLAAGGLMEQFGFEATATGYCLAGLL
jgi:hypothetical protein